MIENFIKADKNELTGIQDVLLKRNEQIIPLTMKLTHMPALAHLDKLRYHLQCLIKD